jgi:hypothetical protein
MVADRTQEYQKALQLFGGGSVVEISRVSHGRLKKQLPNVSHGVVAILFSHTLSCLRQELNQTKSHLLAPTGRRWSLSFSNTPLNAKRFELSEFLGAN